MLRFVKINMLMNCEKKKYQQKNLKERNGNLEMEKYM